METKALIIHFHYERANICNQWGIISLGDNATCSLIKFCFPLGDISLQLHGKQARERKQTTVLPMGRTWEDLTQDTLVNQNSILLLVHFLHTCFQAQIYRSKAAKALEIYFDYHLLSYHRQNILCILSVSSNLHSILLKKIRMRKLLYNKDYFSHESSNE